VVRNIADNLSRFPEKQQATEKPREPRWCMNRPMVEEYPISLSWGV